MRVLGIDLGSRFVKMIVMRDMEIVHEQKISTMHFYRDFSTVINGEIALQLDKCGISDIAAVVSTGYGRNNINIKGAVVINELKAHVYGALYQTERKDFTLLDIGGQDFKIVRVEKGIITDLILNDKCAASSGRYLENMANVLEISLDELTKYYENPVELNSTCAVFAESELIGKIAEKYPIHNLAAGVNYSLFKKIKPLLKSFKKDTLVLTGGVAENPAVQHYLRQLFKEVIVPSKPQLNGAIGAAYYGEMKFKFC